MSAYRRDSDENQYFFLDKKNGELLQKYNEIWNKVSNTTKKDLIVNLFTMKSI